MAAGQVFIVDETGAANRVGTDSGRNAAIGGAAGVSRLSANGTAFCGASGVLQSGRVLSASVNPTVSSVSISQGGSSAITTSGGRFPLALIANGSRSFEVIFTTVCTTQNNNFGQFRINLLGTNTFTIFNTTSDASGGTHGCTPPPSGTCSYVYL